MEYDVLASGYDELYREEQVEKLEFVKKKIKIKERDRLLDVGCGTGISTNFFKCESVGVDASVEMVKKGKGNLLVADAEALPFKDHVFDVVLCVTAMHNFNDHKKAFFEMKRVLRYKGNIVLTILKKAGKHEEIVSFLKEQGKFKEYTLQKDTILILAEEE